MTPPDPETTPPQQLSLAAIVEGFLSLAMVAPEKPPRTQRDQQANRAMIVGFNRAQETLRQILADHGRAPSTKALAEVRADGQERPMRLGDHNVWVG